MYYGVLCVGIPIYIVPNGVGAPNTPPISTPIRPPINAPIILL